MSTRAAISAAEQLIEKGFVSHPFLGVSGIDVNREIAERYAEEFGIELDGGAVIEEVVEGSGAAEGGIEEGDIIVAISGEAIEDMTDLVVSIRRFEPGEVIDVTVLRDGETVELQVELGERAR